MTEVTLDIIIDVDKNAENPEKSNFDESAKGCIEIMEDRVYLTAGNICLGFDRYVLDELLKREKAGMA